MCSLRIIFCIFSLIGSNESSKILAVFPVPSIKYPVVFHPLMQELAKRGHEVVVITADPVFPKGQASQNLTEIDVHDLSYKIWNNFSEIGIEHSHVTSTRIKIFLDKILDVFEAQVKSEEVQKLLNDKGRSFNLLFVDSCVRPALSFAYRYNVPVIEFSSLGGVFGTWSGIGDPKNFLLYPLPLQRKINDLSLWRRKFEIHNDYMIQKVYNKYVERENYLVRGIFGPKVPSLSELKKNVQLIFLNINPIWYFNRPVPPNIIYLGGMHQKPDLQLPKHIKTYLDSSKNGVIYISFGTNAGLSVEKLQMLTNVLSQLAYDILWKMDKDELPARSKNFKISKWLPQSDLLKHPNVKLFITNGGLQSIDEALTAAVPFIEISFLEDQCFNAKQDVKLKIGICLDLETLSETKLKNTIKSTIQDKISRENLVKLQLPLERAVWWTEYVLHSGTVMHSQYPTTPEYYAVTNPIVMYPAIIGAFVGTYFVTNLFRVQLNVLWQRFGIRFRLTLGF